MMTTRFLPGFSSSLMFAIGSPSTREDRTTAGAVRTAMDALTPEQRALIEAAFFEGYTHTELATRFGLPLGTVKTRIRTALMTLRGRLEQVT